MFDVGDDDWRPIQDAPHGRFALMLFSPGGLANTVGGLIWISGGWRSKGGGWRGDDYKVPPTDWRQLPAPPIQSADAGWAAIEGADGIDTALMLFSPGTSMNTEGGLIWISAGRRMRNGWRGDYRKPIPTHYRALPLPPRRFLPADSVLSIVIPMKPKLSPFEE